jgi:hypothetical protein
MFSDTTECQNNKSSDLTHQILLYSLQSEVIKKEFRICDFEYNSIEVFDLNDIISEHPFDLDICGKNVNIYNTTCIDHPSPNSLVIYRLDKIGNNIIKIYFLRPHTGASVIFIYSINEEIKLIDTSIGTF